MAKKLSKKAIEGIAVGLLIVFLVVPGFILGWTIARSMNREPVGPADPVFNVDLDGYFTEDEWKAADYYNFPFYLDVDNRIDPQENKANVDGWNYISIGEDEDNYYIGLDLCSDRTNNLDGEWISLGIGNRIPESYNSELAFYAVENYGFEYLTYNVSEDDMTEYKLILEGGNDYYDMIPFVPEYDSFSLSRGDVEGDYLDLWSNDDTYNEYDIENVVTLSSRYYDNILNYGAGEWAVLDFAINVSEMFPTHNVSDFLPTINDFYVDMRLTGINASSDFSSYNESADVIWFSILEHGPMPVDIYEPSFMSVYNNFTFTDTGTFQSRNANLDYTQINSTNGMYHFSIAGWNPHNSTDPQAFDVYINKLTFRMSVMDVRTTTGTSISPGNYDVAFRYGSSVNCAEEHRMFEFRVAKSEFPVVDHNKLYVNVAGYGTMGMEGSNYWMYPGINEFIFGGPLFRYYSESDDFLILDMGST